MVLILAPVIKSMLSFRLDTILILKNVEKRLSGKYFSVSIDSNTEATNVAIPFLALFFFSLANYFPRCSTPLCGQCWNR